MPPAYDFKLALTRVIEPTSGPGIELATLAAAARFVGQMKPWRQVRPHWDFRSRVASAVAVTFNPHAKRDPVRWRILPPPVRNRGPASPIRDAMRS